MTSYVAHSFKRQTKYGGKDSTEKIKEIKDWGKCHDHKNKLTSPGVPFYISYAKYFFGLTMPIPVINLQAIYNINGFLDKLSLFLNLWKKLKSAGINVWDY